MYYINLYDPNKEYTTRIAGQNSIIQTVLERFKYNEVTALEYPGGVRVETDNEDVANAVADVMVRSNPKCYVYVSKVVAIHKARPIQTTKQAVTAAGVLPA